MDNRFVPSCTGFIKKFGETEGKKKYYEFLVKSANRYRRNSVSRISTELFDSIKVVIPDLENYGKNEKSIILTDDERQEYKRTYLRLDCEYNGKVIEFQGDAFHANPEIYGPDDTPHPYITEMTSKEIWESDKQKEELTLKRNYVIMYVWSNDYQKNKSGVIKECVKFLKG